MAKETIKEAQKRIFDTYKSRFNATPDFKLFQDSAYYNNLTNKDKKVFTAQTYKTYFFKNFEGSKDLLKAFKDGKIKKGDYVIDTLYSSGNEIYGQYYGGPKESSVIYSVAKNWSIKRGKKITEKKLGIGYLRDFEVDTKGPWGKHHIFFSNELGNHIRKTDIYLKQFVETAKLRKTYSLED